MPAWLGAVIGAAEIAGGIALAATGAGAAAGAWLTAHGIAATGAAVAAGVITMGAAQEINGIGTMLSKGPLGGVSTTTRNPIAPWEICMGRTAVGGSLLFMNEWGDNNKYLDMVFCIADHPSQYVTGLMFDRKIVQLDTTRVPAGVPASTYPQINGGTSFTPIQQKNLDIYSLVRVNDIVTVYLDHIYGSGGDIPLLIEGDLVKVHDVSNHGHSPASAYTSMNGTFRVFNVLHNVGGSNKVQFSYLCGGLPTVAEQSGQVDTQWPDVASNVYMEVLCGTQTLGQTFIGAFAPILDGNFNNQQPWTLNCSAVGKTVVFLRLHYDVNYFPGGIPQISFLLSGKNNILNPDTVASHGGLAPNTRGYTENWALCVADYLCDPTYGYNMTLGVDIGLADLITAAVASDDAVALAIGGTEPRYACNGRFQLTMARGEILKNLLTAGAGRIRESALGLVIQAGKWPGSPTAAPGMSALLPYEWSPVNTVTQLYNGVKGTFLFPGNNWQSSDFPPYAQDTTHDPGHVLGYGTGGGGYSDANMAADGGQRRWLDIQLPFTISASAAQRIAKIELMRRRQFGTGVLRYNLFAYQFTSLDIIEETIPYLPGTWSTGKTLEVSHFRFTPDPSGFVTELAVQETDSSVYDWNAIEELTPAGYSQPTIPSALNPSIPTGLTLLSDSTTEFIEVSGKSHSRILVSWIPPTDGYVLSGGHIEAQYKLDSDLLWTSLPSVDPSSTSLFISDVKDGDQYDVQIRSVNAAAVPSAWVMAGPVTASSSLAGAGVFGPTGGNQYPVYQDALFSQAMFGLTPTSLTMTDGSIEAGAQITPLVNPNVFSALIATPLLSPVITYATGGSIPAGTTGYLAIALLDSAGDFTALSDIVPFTIPTAMSELTFTPTIDVAAVSVLIYTGTTPESLSYRFSKTPAGTITLTTLATSTGDAYPIPDSQFANFVAGITKVLLTGIFGGTAATMSAIEAKASLGGGSWQLTLSGAAFTTSALIGRILSWISVGIGNPTPIQNYAITANDATSATVSAPTTSGSWATPALDIGDQVYIPLIADPTIWASSGGTQVKDSLLAMTAHVYKGDVLRVFYPDGTNQTAFIADNDATSCTVDAADNFTGPVPLYWWIEVGSFSAMIPSKPTRVSAHEPLGLSFFVPFDNIAALNAVQVFAQDGFNNLSPAPESPMRPLWWPGAAASIADTAPPPTPAFTADATIPGSIHLSAVNFAGATLNLETVSVLQFGVYYESNLAPSGLPVSLALGAASVSTDLTISIKTLGSPNFSNYFFLIDNEIVALISIASSSSSGGFTTRVYNCLRGVRLSTAANHTTSADVQVLRCQTYMYNFVAGFWNPAIGTAWEAWEATETLPGQTIAFIDLVAINAVGISPLATNNYLPTGLLTGTPTITANPNPGYADVTMDGSNNFTLDLANGFRFRIVLDTTTATGTPPTTIATLLAIIWTGGTIATAIPSVTLYVDQDATGGWPLPNVTGGAGGFASDVALQGIAGDPSTRTTYIFTFHGTVWGLDSFRTGGSIT